MSKLADRIRSATRIQAQAIGFAPTRTTQQATMVLAGVAPDAGGAGELAERGADVVIIGGPHAPTRPEAAPAAGAIVGAYIAGEQPDEAKRFREAGFDFVIVDPDRAAATALLDETIGYVLRLPSDLSDLEVRALEGFRLDAIDLGELASPMTVRRQINLQRIFALTRKPLIATVRADISAPEMQALRDTNVPVVAVSGGADAIARLRATIDALPPRARRKDDGERMTPFVPRAAGHGEADEHEHDDE